MGISAQAIFDTDVDIRANFYLNGVILLLKE